MQIKVPRVPKEQELQIKNLIWLLHEFNSIYIINRIVCLYVCLCTSTLAIFMDRFWNQGYLWTPHGLEMTRKI